MPSGASNIPTVDTLAVKNVPARRENNKEDHHDGSEDEGPGHEGDVIQVPADKCAGHG